MDPEFQPTGRSFRHRYEGPFFRKLMLGGIRYMPRSLQRLTMPFWAGIFYALVSKARAAAERNLEQVLGPMPSWRRKQRSFRLFVNYAQMLTDTYATHMGQPTDLEAVTFGRSHLLDALAHGHGVIAATGHLGMWQIGPFLARWRELPRFYVAMAEEPNPLVQQFEQRFRENFQIIYTTESTFSGLRLASALKDNAIVGMQMDRHLGTTTVALPMCGATGRFTIGPAALARATGAALVPSFFVVEPAGRRRRIVQYLEPAIEVARSHDRDADVIEATTKLVQIYERFVRRYPEQWYQFYDFFTPLSPAPDRYGIDCAEDGEGEPRPPRLA